MKNKYGKTKKTARQLTDVNYQSMKLDRIGGAISRRCGTNQYHKRTSSNWQLIPTTKESQRAHLKNLFK